MNTFRRGDVTKQPANRRPADTGKMIALIYLAWAWATTSAVAQVRLNELTVAPAGASESVELYNGGPDISIDGWVIQGSKGSYTVPPGTVLPTGSYTTLDVGDIMHERGGVTSLIDLVRGSGRLAVGIDSVHYGTEGSAPLPPAGTSLARAPDAADGLTPPPDPGLDGLVWTIDFTPTFGAHNDAPVPAPGLSIVMNEFDPTSPGGLDMLELFNPTPLPESVNGWLLVNGDAVWVLNGFIPPLFFQVVTTLPGYDLDAAGLLYLFRFDGVRVDQLGFHDAPPLPPGTCFARCPDGAEPFLGYDFASSGGGFTFVERFCTPEGPNCTPESVPVEPPGLPYDSDPTAPPAPGGTLPGSWGEVKALFRTATQASRGL